MTGGTEVAHQPSLIIINGAPASGKSTLAERLTDELHLPLIAKDSIKEVLADALGAPTRERSRELSGASYDMVIAMIGWLLDAGVGAVVDCNFRAGRAEDALRPLVLRARSVLIQCVATQEEIVRRYRERAANGLRHPCHFDAEIVNNDPTVLDVGAYAALTLPIPTLPVQTTRGYEPSLDDVVAFVRAALT